MRTKSKNKLPDPPPWLDDKVSNLVVKIVDMKHEIEVIYRHLDNVQSERTLNNFNKDGMALKTLLDKVFPLPTRHLRIKPMPAAPKNDPRVMREMAEFIREHRRDGSDIGLPLFRGHLNNKPQTTEGD